MAKGHFWGIRYSDGPVLYSVLARTGLTDLRYLRPSPNVLGYLAVTNCAWKEFKELLTFRENPEDEAVHCSPMLCITNRLVYCQYFLSKY